MKNAYQVVIVGAGFAGTAAAKYLGRRGIEVLLIDSNNYHQFQPLLYQIATAQIDVSSVALPLRAMFARQSSVRVLTANVTAIDAAERSVTVADGSRFTAEQLVIACGATPNFFGTPGAEEHSYPLYSVLDAARLGSELVKLLDRADRDPTGSDGIGVVVVGGGPTGVETAGALAENIREVLPKYFSAELASKCTVHLVDLLPTVLAPFSKQSQHYAKVQLAKAGVRIQLGSGVSEVRSDGVTLADDTRIPAQIVVWAGGLKAGALLADSGLPQGKGGRIDVQPDLKAPGFEGVYVVGDAANMTDSRGEKLPQLGSVAQQAGRWAARNIIAERGHAATEPFDYTDKGYMAMIGRGAAVAELGRKRYRLHGLVAFLGWLAVHAALLPGNLQRVTAASAWLSDYLTHARAHVILGAPGENSEKN